MFVLCGCYFSGTESAFTAMNKIKIKSQAEDGNRRAKSTLYISNNFDRALSTILIGNNVARTAAASVATIIAAREFGHISNYGLWTTVITTGPSFSTITINASPSQSAVIETMCW